MHFSGRDDTQIANLVHRKPSPQIPDVLVSPDNGVVNHQTANPDNGEMPHDIGSMSTPAQGVLPLLVPPSIGLSSPGNVKPDFVIAPVPGRTPVGQAAPMNQVLYYN